MNTDQKIAELIKNGTEATKRMDNEVVEFTGKIPQYIMDSTDLIVYSTIISVNPIAMEQISKLLMVHCDHLYKLGFLHGKEVGKEEWITKGMNDMAHYIMNENADILKN